MERNEYKEVKIMRSASPYQNVKNSRQDLDSSLDHLLEDLQNSVSRPGSSLGHHTTNSLNRLTKSTNPVTEYSSDDAYTYKSPDGREKVHTYKKEKYIYGTSTGGSYPEINHNTQNNINQLDSLLDDLQQVKRSAFSDSIEKHSYSPQNTSITTPSKSFVYKSENESKSYRTEPVQPSYTVRRDEYYEEKTITDGGRPVVQSSPYQVRKDEFFKERTITDGSQHLQQPSYQLRKDEFFREKTITDTPQPTYQVRKDEFYKEKTVTERPHSPYQVKLDEYYKERTVTDSPRQVQPGYQLRKDEYFEEKTTSDNYRPYEKPPPPIGGSVVMKESVTTRNYHTGYPERTMPINREERYAYESSRNVDDNRRMEPKPVNIQYSYKMTDTQHNTYKSSHEPEPLLPHKFPTDNQMNGGPPKRLDDLMATIEREPPTSPLNAGFVAHEKEMIQKKKADTLKRQAEEADDMQKKEVVPTKNVQGPPVYYPPGHEMFVKKEESGGAWRAQGEYGKASGKYEYGAESMSKSKSKSGAAVIPVCLPLCCGLPCSLL